MEWKIKLAEKFKPVADFLFFLDDPTVMGVI